MLHLHDFAAAKTWKPAQQNCKHQDQQDPDQEGRQRNAQQRQRHEQLAGESTAFERRVDAHRNPNGQGQKGSYQRQLQRRREPFSNQPGYLGTLAQTQTKLTLCRIHQKMPELDEKRAVQPQVLAQLANLLGGGILPQQEHDGISHILKQHEGDEGHGDHHDHCLDQAAQYKGEHQEVE